MRATTAIDDLAASLYSACHNDLDNIVYETYDYSSVAEFKIAKFENMPKVTKERRPTTYDVEVYAMFVQTWGSTALGFGGMGGAAMTPAYTIIIKRANEYAVYFSGRFAYKVKNPNNTFFDNIKIQNMKAVRHATAYVSNSTEEMVHEGTD